MRWPSEWAWPMSLPQEASWLLLWCAVCAYSSEWECLVLHLDLRFRMEQHLGLRSAVPASWTQ